MTYTITVFNAGPTVTLAMLEDRLPPGIVVQHTDPLAAIDAGGANVRWIWPLGASFGQGAVFTATMSAAVPPTMAPGIYPSQLVLVGSFGALQAATAPLTVLSPTPTFTPAPLPTGTVTPSATVTSTTTPQATVTATVSPTATVAASVTPTLIPTVTVAASVTPTLIPTVTVTPLITITAAMTRASQPLILAACRSTFMAAALSCSRMVTCSGHVLGREVRAWAG